jgi:DNA-binding response OmpR family regulator
MIRAKVKPKSEPIGKVLLVEDDAILSMTIEEALLDAGAAGVEVVATASDALKSLKNGRYNAVVLDVHLADSDNGWAVAELVKASGPRQPRIIFSTGSPQDIPEKIGEMGAILTKPYDPQDLVACLRHPQHKGLFSRLRRKKA